jgi:sarcosine oxidase subunit beta
MNRVIVCRCEDVTLGDLEHAVAKGYRDIEEVKRYTGFGTGPCQGKECVAVVALALARITGTPPGEIEPFTSRPPLTPTPLKFFVNDPSAEDPEDEEEGQP